MNKLNLKLFEKNQVRNSSNLISIIDELGKEITENGNGYFSHNTIIISSNDLILEFSLYIIVKELAFEYKVIKVLITNSENVEIKFYNLINKNIVSTIINISNNTVNYENKLIELLSGTLFVNSLKFLINQVNLKRDYKKTIKNKIIEGEAKTIRLKNGDVIPAGFIRIEDELVFYYTGMGLRELFSPTSNKDIKKSNLLKQESEEVLLKKGYIDIVKISDIEEIY